MVQVEEGSDEDKIRFDTGGTERVIIDSNGNTTIKSDSSGGGGVLNLENTTTAVNGQAWGSINFISNDSSTSASGTRASIIGTSTSFNGDGNITFSTAPASGTNAERMRISSTGNVLIGNTDGSGILNINNGANDGGYVHFANNVGATTLTNDRGLAVGWNKSNGQGESVIIANQGGGSVGGLVLSLIHISEPTRP